MGEKIPPKQIYGYSLGRCSAVDGGVSVCCCCCKKPEFTDKKVMAGKEYEYRVTAENAGGESEPSEVSEPIKAKPLKGQ